VTRKPRVVVVMALRDESAGLLETAGAEVLYTGVGKVNATYALTKYLIQARACGGAMPRILNLGTAGSSVFASGRLVGCHRFIQRDMDATALGFAAGATPFDPTPAELVVDVLLPHLPAALCSSGDSFLTGAAPLAGQVAEMEAFALARVCMAEGVSFACAKYVTDGLDSQSAGDWTGSLPAAADALVTVYREYVTRA
jgi:adenosylhomocysteine nucleosidase